MAQADGAHSLISARGIIGVPCRDVARFSVFWQCVDGLRRPEGTHLLQGRSASVAHSRNMIIRDALRVGAEWVFFLDDDQMFRPNILEKMLARNVDVLIGMTLFRRSADDRFWPIWADDDGVGISWEPVREVRPGANGLVPLASGTAGGLLIRRRVLEAMADPWFVIGQDGPKDELWEDISFYRAARRAGFDVWGDPEARFGHMTTHAVWPHQDEDGAWHTVIAREFDPILVSAWPQLTATEEAVDAARYLARATTTTITEPQYAMLGEE